MIPINRRRFVQGAASAGALLARPALAAPTLLSGTEFALEIGEVPINITGRPGTAVGINGLVPAPILRWREGETVSIAVTNRLREHTSIHWHGVRVPSAMDGVPGMSFPGIAPGATFIYRFPVTQAGTYWYHGHSGFQEQIGLYGAIVIEPRAGYTMPFDRDYVVLLSDWSDDSPASIVSNLKFQSDYYNFGQRTAGTFAADTRRQGIAATLADRLAWGRMRMSPADILDVNGSTYTYLINGQPPDANWTALYRPGERVRLRFINGSAMSIFDVRIPGLALTVVQADGNDVAPVTVDEFRIGAGETYDVIVRPDAGGAYAIFAQAMDRSGFARGTLAPRPGMSAPVPAMDRRPLRTMADMGMAGMAMGETMDHGSAGHGVPAPSGIGVDNTAPMPAARQDEPGTGLEDNGRRVLTYADLRALRPGGDSRAASREIVLHLTGNMQRFIWGFDGEKASDAPSINLRRGERVRIVLINDTMMEHPTHLHGLWSELENGQVAPRPLKHTILVKPGERLAFLVTADEPGRWAFHCHLLYHMQLGMIREVRVS